MEKIGRIKYVSKGEYSPDVTYTQMNVALFEGSLWECLKETTGNPPPDHVKNEDGSIAENEFWRLFLPGALGDDYIKKTDIAKAPTEAEPGKLGVFFPDGKTLQINEETGELTGTPVSFAGSWKELQEAIESGEVEDGMVGYIRDTGDEGEDPDPDHPYNMLFDFDTFLSTVSTNAVQNWVVTTALNRIEQLSNEIKELRAGLETFGLGKIVSADVTDVTEANGLVCGAFEKNPNVEGSLANVFQTKFSNLTANLADYKILLNKKHVSGGTQEVVALDGNITDYRMISFVYMWTGSGFIYDQVILPTSFYMGGSKYIVLSDAPGNTVIQISSKDANSVYITMTDNPNTLATIIAWDKK